MSYINEALKKAQTEKDNRYGKVGYVIPASSEKRGRPRPQLIIAVLVALVIITVAAGLLFVKFTSPPLLVARALPEATAKRGAAVADTIEKSAAVPPAAVAGKTLSAEKEAAAEKAARVKRFYDDARLAQRSGNFSKAKVLYGEALTLDADHVEALNNLGVVYLAEKKTGKALALFRRAILLKKDYVDPYYNMACLYAQKNDISQSLWYLKMAISINEEVKDWAKSDTDMKKVVASPKFKEIEGGAKN